MDLNEFAKEYLGGVRDSLDKVDLDTLSKIVEELWKAYENGKQVFVMGNGGSASTASHFACDLGKGTVCDSDGKKVGNKRFKVIALTDNIPLMTAWSNDSSYENMFSEQLVNLVNEGDVVIGISGSGNSKNVLKAVELAKERGAVTIGLSGFAGGELKNAASVCLIAPSDVMRRVEDIHLMVVHLIAEYFYQKIRG